MDDLVIVIGAALFGSALTLLATYRTTRRISRIHLSQADIHIAVDLMKSLMHVSRIAGVGLVDYLDAAQTIWESKTGSNFPPVIIDRKNAGLEISKELLKRVKENELSRLLSEIDAQDFLWIDKRDPISRIGNGRKTNCIAFAMTEGNTKRYYIQSVPEIPEFKKSALVPLLKEILLAGNDQRSLVRARTAAKTLVEALQLQNINLIKILGGIQHNFKGIFVPFLQTISNAQAARERGGMNDLDAYQAFLDSLIPTLPLLFQISSALDESLIKSLQTANVPKEEYEVQGLGAFFDENFTAWLIEEEQINDQIKIEIGEISKNFQIFAAPSVLFQVVWNILHNAIKYTHKGRIGIDAFKGSDGLIYLRVVDTGSGIGAADLNRIGEYDFRASNVEAIPGQGVGLWFSKFLLEASGGNFIIQSEPNIGTMVGLGFQEAENKTWPQEQKD